MKIGIIMGSKSDYNVMKDASLILDEFNISYEISVVSAHRTPDKLYEYAKEAKSNGIDIIIAGAGGAAHLPGMVAALSTIPVIGIPIKLDALNGLDSLLSIVQMPKGVPVATMGINQSANGALLAVQMLSINNEELSNKYQAYKDALVALVEDMVLE